MSLAEKFQITIPPKKEESDQNWVSPSTTRLLNGVPCNEGDQKFNIMPSLQINSKDHSVFGYGGNTDVSGGLEPETFKKGFFRREMKATDDQYGGEHIDLFYGEAIDEDGNVGFVERNNYLDRL
jgi:hypothetical protein